MEITIPKSKTGKKQKKQKSRIHELSQKEVTNPKAPDLNKLKYTVGYTGIIPMELISPDPNQPRKNFDVDKIKELAASIQEQGLIQPPAVRKDGDNFIIVVGERRYRAHKELELKEMVCTIIKTDKPEELALVENIQRENLNPIEEAEGFAVLQKKFGYKQEELAKRVGKSRNTITETLSLNKLPDEIKQECLRADIPKRALVMIAREKNKQEQINLFNKIKSGEYSSEDTRKNKRKLRKPNSPLVSIALNKTKDLNKLLKKLVESYNEATNNHILSIKDYILKIEGGEHLLESLIELRIHLDSISKDISQD